MITPNDTNTIDREAVATKLDEARALIERGWVQGSYENAHGNCFCSLGAIEQVGGDCWNELPELWQPLAQAIGTNPCEGFAIATWNDAPGRTQAEVVEAFRKAAELARTEQVQA